MTFVIVLAGIVVILPVVGWIAALLWAARRDGREEEDFKRTHPPEG